MNKFLILLIGIGFSIGLNAQELTETKIHFEFVNGYWLLDFKAGNPLAILGLDTRYPNKNIKSMEMNDYRELYRDYLNHSFVFMIDSQLVELKNVKVVMNSSSADGQFISPRYETPGNEIYIQCKAYSDLPNHRTLFTVKNGTWIARDTLDSANDFGSRILINHQPD